MQLPRSPKLNLNCHCLCGRLGDLGLLGRLVGLVVLVGLGHFVGLFGLVDREHETREGQLQADGRISSSLDRCRCIQIRSSWTEFGL